ncbi:hypothetical protein [Bacillus sp. EAC]|uniref:hypothetical protein n=1 Tax=Bacillus sp. EAC TaxID=1978338 RepID=UPI000B43C149|nr:hypothetical protein [Bacillus sp. EAC]
MKKLGILLVLILLTSASTLFLKPRATFACSCVKEQTVQKEFSQSKAVFSGKVIDIKTTKFSNPNYKKVLFEVSKTWKGITSSQVIIQTGLSGGDCGFNFNKGEIYIVYARNSTMYGENYKSLTTTICDRTKELSLSHEDLTILGEGKKPTNNVNYEDNFQRNKFEIVIVIFLVGCILTLLITIFRKSMKKRN